MSRIGRGGMGIVWHAYDELLDRDVAVKAMLFTPELTEVEYDVLYRRTLREARLAARLSHPAIVTIHDIIEEDQRPWIVMELVSARSLDELVRQDGPLEPLRVAEIGLQMADALIVAHGADVLHRDIKPSNVLVSRTRAGRAVLTDFGIALAHRDATITQGGGGLIGSPAYIAPERARGQPVAPASDLWSLGATLYCAVEGRSPFERPETVASLVAVQNEEPAPMERAGPLRPVIEGMLRKNPEERLTAAEVAAALDLIVAGDPGRSPQTEELTVSASSPPRTEASDREGTGRPEVGPEQAAARRFRRWPLLLMILVVVAVLFIFATVGALTGRWLASGP